MNILKAMAEEAVVREVLDTYCEMEPAQKWAGFFISKIVAKLRKVNISKVNFCFF